MFGIICLIRVKYMDVAEPLAKKGKERRGFTLVHNIHNFNTDGKTKKRKSTAATMDLDFRVKTSRRFTPGINKYFSVTYVKFSEKELWKNRLKNLCWSMQYVDVCGAICLST